MTTLKFKSISKQLEDELPEISDFEKIRLVELIREYLPPGQWKENFGGQR